MVVLGGVLFLMSEVPLYPSDSQSTKASPMKTLNSAREAHGDIAEVWCRDAFSDLKMAT